MLKGTLYYWEDIQASTDGECSVQVTLNPAHEIFLGHFPNHPILPGVCLLEMLREIIREKTGLPFLLNKAQNIKYLKLVDPNESPTIHFKIDMLPTETGLSVSASSSLINGEINFKFKGLFIEKR